MLKWSKAVLFAGSFLLFSCQQNKTVAEGTSQAKPLKIYEQNGYKIPSYDFDNLEYFLNRKDDKVYVVNFWATWCQPCVEELPHFESINTSYKHKGVNVILVNLDFPKMIESRLFPFMTEYNIQSEVVILNDPDTNTWIPKVDKNWSGAIPVTIIYNKDKRIFYEKTFTLDELKTEVEKFL
ncbi:MAG: redoxin domain-containing protein [Flavobacteriaceae bacterium]